MQVFKRVLPIINIKTVFAVTLAITSMQLCEYWGLAANFSLTFVGVAIIFPLVFSINSAYARRESALAQLRDFIMFSVGIYHASRDWIRPTKVEFQKEIREELIVLFDHLKALFTSQSTLSMNDKDRALFERYSQLSKSMQGFRDHGLSGSEMSRLHQYVLRVGQSMEQLKIILEYRTPTTLRAYSKISV